MNSAFPTSLNLNAAIELSGEYQRMNFFAFESGEDSEDKKILAVFLHGKRLVEPIKYQTKLFGKGASTSKGRVVQTSYDRFFLFGDVDSNKVFALFASNDKESRVLTRYHAHLSPGCCVSIIEPRLKGVMIDTTNTLITTSEPFIPLQKKCPIGENILPPYDLSSESDMIWFHFVTTSLSLKYPVPTVDLCSGHFCDGQAAGSSLCVCVEKTGLPEWGIRCLVACDELDLTRTAHQKSTFVSVKFSKMCVVNHNFIKPQDSSFQLIAFRRNLREFINEINNLESNAGYEVMGWFKPSKQDGESFHEVHEYHIISITPLINPLPDNVLCLRYPRPPRIVLSDAPSSTPPDAQSSTPSDAAPSND